MDPLEKQLVKQRDLLVQFESVYGPSSAAVIAAKQECAALEAQVKEKGSTLSALLLAAEDDVRMAQGVVIEAQIKRDRLRDELRIAENELAEANAR